MDSASQAAVIHSPRKPSFFWPEKLLGRRPGLKEVNVLCWALFVAFLLVPICAIAVIHLMRGTEFIRQMQPDFIYFYGDGEIAARYPAVRIYDYTLQMQTFTAIHHPQGGVYGPSPYPPFVALFFSTFTHISFEAAYFLWMVISLTLYLAGALVITRDVFPDEPLKVSLVICFALAYFPFLFSTFISGQLASVGLCTVALAIYLERRGNPFRSGLVLALLIYKPTLVPLIVLMLLLTRRFRAFRGFATGAASLTLITTIITGPRVWLAYAHMLTHFGGAAAVSGTSRLQLWGHLDLDSCFAAIPGGRSAIGTAILISMVLLSLGTLAVLLWKSRRSGKAVQALAWAATLMLTLLLNVYTPMYDSVLVVIAVILTLGALRDLKWEAATEWITLLAVVILLTSWETEPFAKAHKVQLLTIVLMVLAAAQLWFLHRAIQQEKAAATALAA